ncbi:MAG TPA: hypothetical protein VKR06_09190 [Ktedonosporobacter sp.]|nr:hypothetical protein [Ktedonosporobacter sp.]
MPYMPFKDDQQPLYADEHENILFRVKDLKQRIEDSTHLPVIGLMSLGSRDDPESLKELYGDLLPERVWFVRATFQTPEGRKTSEIFVILKEGQLQFPRGISLHLETFLAPHRKQAKQDIPELTLDYIETLEGAVSDTWRFWRDLAYFLDHHHAHPFVREVLKPQFKDQLSGLYNDFKAVNFLTGSDEATDPFPGGNFNFIEKRDQEEEK